MLTCLNRSPFRSFTLAIGVQHHEKILANCRGVVQWTACLVGDADVQIRVLTGEWRSSAARLLWETELDNTARKSRVGLHGEWRSSAARLLWEQEVPGSNPGSPTTYIEANSLG